MDYGKFPWRLITIMYVYSFFVSVLQLQLPRETGLAMEPFSVEFLSSFFTPISN